MTNWMIRVVVLACTVFFMACGNAPNKAVSTNGNVPAAGDNGKRMKIGFSMDTVKEERWVRDKDAFDAHCKAMNVDCIITVADNKSDKQANDVDNLLTQGVNVLVIAPHDATQAASMVEKAKAQGVPVISYDRLINSDKIDLYGLTTITDSAKEFGERLARAGIELAKALQIVEDFKGLDPILQNIHRLENEGDDITRVALQKLFADRKQTPADLIKWKDIYALLESTLDECESVAEIMETIAIKNA